MIGVGAESSPVPSAVDRRSIRTWSVVDKATETEQEDTENDDVPLSGLLHCSRRDADEAQVNDSSLYIELKYANVIGRTPVCSSSTLCLILLYDLRLSHLNKDYLLT